LFGGITFVSLLGVNYKVPSEGLNYYNCEGIKNIRSYVINYAAKTNNMKLYSQLEEKLVVEVSNTYIYNLALSQKLEAKLYMN